MANHDTNVKCPTIKVILIQKIGKPNDIGAKTTMRQRNQKVSKTKLPHEVRKETDLQGWTLLRASQLRLNTILREGLV